MSLGPGRSGRRNGPQVEQRNWTKGSKNTGGQHTTFLTKCPIQGWAKRSEACPPWPFPGGHGAPERAFAHPTAPRNMIRTSKPLYSAGQPRADPWIRPKARFPCLGNREITKYLYSWESRPREKAGPARWSSAWAHQRTTGW